MCGPALSISNPGAKKKKEEERDMGVNEPVIKTKKRRKRRRLGGFAPLKKEEEENGQPSKEGSFYYNVAPFFSKHVPIRSPYCIQVGAKTGALLTGNGVMVSSSSSSFSSCPNHNLHKQYLEVHSGFPYAVHLNLNFF